MARSILRRGRVLPACVLVACGWVGLATIPVADAALLNFEGLPASSQTSGTPPANTVLTDNFKSLGVVFGLSGVSAGVSVNNNTSLAPSSGVNSVVGLDASGNITFADTDDIYFSFVVPNTNIPATTNSVSFTIGDAGGDIDTFVIHAFNLANSEISTQNVQGASRFPVNINVAGINRVRIEFTADPAGYSMDDLSFTDIPEPATAVLAGGMAAPLLLRRRRIRR
jgi:hypothetical protein